MIRERPERQICFHDFSKSTWRKTLVISERARARILDSKYVTPENLDMRYISLAIPKCC
jgi:hypothetical protein